MGLAQVLIFWCLNSHLIFYWLRNFSSDVEAAENSYVDNSYSIEPEEINVEDQHPPSSSPTGADDISTIGELHLNGTSKEENPPSSPKKRENAFLESWRINFEADIKARDEKEAMKRAELEAAAKKVTHLFELPMFALTFISYWVYLGYILTEFQSKVWN